MSTDPSEAQTATAERLYLSIYERMAGKSDYLQPESYRQMLPEAVIIAGVVSIVTGILKGVADGFLKKIGANLADYSGKLMGRLKSEEPTPDNIVLILSDMTVLFNEADANWDGMSAYVALELTRQGMNFAASQELARETMTAVRQGIGRTDV